MNQSIFKWAVIGAGPSGIAAVGKLLDTGIRPTEILWLDPSFQVGDLGRYWSQVSSNTSVQLFIKFLMAVDAFGLKEAKIDFAIHHLPKEKTCLLQHMVEPLQWITNHLCERITTDKTMVHHMALSNNRWSIHTDTKTYQASNVILATGAVPDVLHYPDIQTLPFETAIDKERLRHAIDPKQTYAIFGSSHSAIMIIQSLVDLNAHKIINFFRSPCRYAIPFDDFILFDNTGLKGDTARWARQHIDGQLPNNLYRYNSNPSNIAQFLPECDKAIYAVGFTKRHSIAIEGGYEHHRYNPHVGIIGPGLFGLGIAYPEIKPDPFGSFESQVGLWKFMVYLNKILPVWIHYHT